MPDHLHHIVIGVLSDQNIHTTLTSAISQLADPGITVAVTVVIDRGAPTPDMGSDAVRYVEANVGIDLAARENLGAYSLPTADTIRFLHDGDLLAPSATVDDVRALQRAPWCASGVADTEGPVIHRRTAGPIPTGTLLDEWAAPTPALTVHPNSVAYTFGLFAALGGHSAIEFAHRTDLMVRACERAPGHYRTGPASLTVRPHATVLAERPLSFGRDRLAIALALLSGRTADIDEPARTLEQQWDDISDEAWATYTVGTATTIADTDTLHEVMVQARKLHFRFAWAPLVDYIDSAGGRFDAADDYLTGMYLTARAASTGDWSDAIEFTQTHRAYRIIHLLLTTVFETSTTDPEVLQPALDLTDTVLDLRPDDPVALYRKVSFHRMLGDYLNADRWRRRALDVIATLPNPQLSDHLRERILVEAITISAHLRPAKEIFGSTQPRIATG